MLTACIGYGNLHHKNEIGVVAGPLFLIVNHIGRSIRSVPITMKKEKKNG
jgi:hypothetical protein